ncbi:hypothetical protein HY415_01225 [Candidatus Kaiserbacteria bacterium]|nr:hypothetical protein [Candidatus Kaiserbacteria bacterium]
MNEAEQTVSNRTVMVNTLAIVGFVALIGASMWLAVYSARYVPEVVTRFGSAAVYLGSVFNPSTASLSVVPTPTATTTIPSTEVSSTPSKPAAPAEAKPAPTTPGEKTTSVVQISGAAATNALTGLPDLVVTIKAIGYLATSSADSFIATSTVPSGRRPAVSFTIKNVGTNASGSWRFSATIPTQSFFLYQSQPQQSLNPGDSIDYTLGFDQATAGADKMISITANFDRTVAELNLDNNSASTKLTILGG